MGLKDVLAKMKLVELDPPADPSAPPPSRGKAPPAAPRPRGPQAASGKPGSATRPPAPAGAESIEEILSSLPRPSAKVAEMPLEASPDVAGGLADFDAIYRAAGIQPPAHGFTAHKVLEILGSPHFAALDARARAAALAGFLEMNPAGRVSIRDVIEDAVRRDEALDAYEQALAAKMQAELEAAQAQNRALQTEIDDLTRRNQDRMRANLESADAATTRLVEWQRAKQREEARLFQAVAPFVEANPVSVGDVGATPETPSRDGRGP